MYAVGDPAQTSATIISCEKGVQRILSHSLLSKALHFDTESGTPAYSSPLRLHLLDKQFRMHPVLSEFPRKTFYGGRLFDGMPPERFQLPWHYSKDGPQHEKRRSGCAESWYDPGYLFGPLLYADTSTSRAMDTRFVEKMFLAREYGGSSGN